MYAYVHCERSIASLSRQTRLALGKTLRYYGAWLVNPSTGRVTQIGFPAKEEREREREREKERQTAETESENGSILFQIPKDTLSRVYTYR